MKTLIAGIVGATLAFSGSAYAQDKYPSKPIRMIVGYAPGGGSDIMGRLIDRVADSGQLAAVVSALICRR